MAAQEIPANCWSSGELKTHLNQALAGLHTKVSSAVTTLESLLPGLSKVYHYADPATVGTSLHNTFSNASSYPAQCNVLHQYFAGTWPTSEVVQSGYNPQVIFDAAAQLARQYPAEAKHGLLHSIESILSAGLVGAENGAILSEVACIIWHNHPAEAESFLARTTVALSVDQLAKLPDVIHWSEAHEVEWLKNAWANAAKNQSPPERLAATLQIVAKGPIGTSELPDQGLTLWALSLGAGAYEVFKQSVLSTEVADQGRRRLWRQLLSLRTVQPPQELIDLATHILALPSAPEAADAVSEDLKQLCSLITDQDIRYRSATALLNCLPQCPSMAIKANLAQLAFQLGSQAVLRDVDAANLSQQDLEVIEGKFGKGRELSKLQKRFGESR